MMTQFSIYGASGFIGSHLCFNADERVPRNQIHCKHSNVIYCISTNNNYVMLDDVTKDVNTNLVHLLKCLEQFRLLHPRGVFNFLSSWFVYGESGVDPVDENYPLNPVGFYSITKRCAEDLIKDYCRTYNLRYRILRLASIYGLDQNSSSKKNALVTVIRKLAANEQVTLFWEGNFIRDFMYIDDAINAIRFVANNGELDRTYNVGSGKPTYFIEPVLLAKDFLSSNSVIHLVPSAPVTNVQQIKNCCLNTKNLNTMGYVSSFTLHDGVLHLCRKIKS